ncbi:MAG: hypothetical protein ACOWWO_14705 [Peptococcaceae bacterium]
MKKISDRIFLGIISGILGGVPSKLINAFEYHVGLTDVKYSQLSSSLFLPAKKVKNSNAHIIGSIANNTGIAIVGVLITYLLSITGRDKLIVKGLGVTSTAWLFVYGLISRLGLPIKTKKTLTPLLSFIDHAALGIFTALIVSKLGDDSLFPAPHAPAAAEDKLPLIGVAKSPK